MNEIPENEVATSVIPTPIYMQDALYQDTGLSIYRDNPLIEALPPILSRKQFIKQIRYRPEYDESERQKPARDRLHLISEVTEFFHPLTNHIDLEQSLSRLMRQGYKHRNPFTRGYWRQSDQQLRELDGELRVSDRPRPQRNSTLGMAFVGFSGMGKSTSLKEILTNGYPHLIYHTEYKGEPFVHHQIPWLMVDCPHNASIKQLCNRILMGLDMRLGTRYLEMYGSRGRRTNVDLMILDIARLVQIHTIGVLVIDEIQRLNRAKAQGSDRMMNFFIELINTLTIPILLVGTPDAHRLLSTKFSLARRAAGQGDCYWNPLKNGKSWQSLMKAMWKYQYTKHECKLTTKLSDCLYDESQGIIDIAVKLYMLTQVRAIITGHERVTVAMIQSTAKHSLMRLQPMLSALREKDWLKLRAYDDMEMINLDEHIREAMTELNQKALDEIENEE